MDGLLCKCGHKDRKSKLPDLSSLRDNVVLITGGHTDACICCSMAGRGSQNKGQVTRPAFCFGFFVWFYAIAPSPSMRGLWAESLCDFVSEPCERCRLAQAEQLCPFLLPMLQTSGLGYIPKYNCEW